MKKHEIAPEDRRQVSRKKKILILAFLAVALVATVLYKLPGEKSYRGTLILAEAGDGVSYGETVTVEVHARVQRYFLSSAIHTGTVTVNGETFTTDNGGETVRRFAIGPMEDTDDFALLCREWHGDYLVTRCIAHMDDGAIRSVSLYDNSGAYAGRYTRMP